MARRGLCFFSIQTGGELQIHDRFMGANEIETPGYLTKYSWWSYLAAWWSRQVMRRGIRFFLL